MKDPGQILLRAALSIRDAHAKALASYLFREVIEEAHTKYNISQQDMQSMCKDAVNRAALFIQIKDDPDLYKAFAIHAVGGMEWHDPENSEALEREMKMLRSLAEQVSD